ncbi:hypothetical protein DRI50_06150 [candidate division KSB1 bacterium]|nr:MAG: hypothetical protein DRI50_06150 [candidate division KSB1 bacterium]
MIIRYIELSGFKGIDQTKRIPVEDGAQQSLASLSHSDKLFIYKAIHGIIFGFNEWQKEIFRGDPEKNQTFTGFIHIDMDDKEILVDRDFETDFVAFVLIQNNRFNAVYQGKDFLNDGSHQVYLNSIKPFIFQLHSYLNNLFSKESEEPATIEDLLKIRKAVPDENEFQDAESTAHQPKMRLYVPEHKKNFYRESIVLKYPHLFLEIFNKANKPIFLWGVKPDLTPGFCILANKAACELSGYSMDELKRLTFTDLKSPAFRARMEELLKELIAKGQLNIELENITKDGRIIPVSVDAHTFFIDGQRVILSIVEDISQRKLMEEKLKTSHEKYKALFENARYAVLLLDKTKILDCNSATGKFFGLAKDEIIGQTLDSFCTQILPDNDDVEAKLKDFVQIVLTGGRKCFLCQFKNTSGQERIGDVCLTPLHLQGKYYVQAIIYDLTEYYAVKKELSNKNIQFEDFLKNTLVGIWRMEFSEPIPIDLPAKEIAKKILHEGRLTECNKAFLDMYQVKNADEILGKPPANLSADLDQSLQRITEFVKNNFKAELIESSEKGPDGELYYFQNSFAGHVQDGKLLWMWGMQIDLTEQKKLEEQFLQSQKMEAIGMLAGGIAHDFNNILTVINGYSDMLLRRMDPDHPLLKYITHIRRAGERASHLTKQLLSFSRKQVFQTKTINLNTTISDMLSMIHRIIGEHIEIVTRLSTNLDLIKFDENKIEQIIMNMIVNAKDAMPSGGKLFIETRNVYLDDAYCERHPEAKPGDYVLLSIMDTGHGMSEDVLGHIFEPFFTTKEKGSGTGLGLATVYGIIKQANGHISVRSQLGQGTTFFLYFPKFAEAKNELIAEEDNTVLLNELKGSETILVVEDDETVRQVVVETLTNHGYQVIEAINGSEALEIYSLKADQIDLIISDIVMPQMDGKKFRQKILESNPQCKFIFMSGYTDTSIMGFDELESVEFLQKPFKLTELLRKLRLIFNKKPRVTN